MAQKDNELSACVRKAVNDYFKHLDGEKPGTVYDMVLTCVERPLIETVLYHTEGNQTRASELLGINRNTLRKKCNNTKSNNAKNIMAIIKRTPQCFRQARHS